MKVAKIIASLALLCGSTVLGQEKRRFDLSGSTIAIVSNEYLSAIGFPLNGNNVLQTYTQLNVARNALARGDSFSVFGWSNYDAGKSNYFHEVDLGIGYNTPSVKTRKGEFSGNVNYQRWTYPGLALPTDKILQASLSYIGPINASIGTREHLNNNPGKQRLLEGSVNRSFPVGNLKGAELSATPSLTISHAHNYFGLNGILGYKPGVDLAATRGPVRANAFVNYFAKQGQHFLGETPLENSTQVGVGITYSWNSPFGSK